jgi:hypothetical protein
MMRFIAPVGSSIAALGAVAALTPAAALGRPTPAVSSHRVSLSGEIETLSSTGTIGVAGVKDTDAGILDGTVSGSPRWSGALRQVVTWGPELSIRARGTAFDAGGTLRFTLVGKFAARSTGGLALTGTLTVTGGTGSYRHAHGSLRVTGVASLAAGSTKSTFDLSGALRYPKSHG